MHCQTKVHIVIVLLQHFHLHSMRGASSDSKSSWYFLWELSLSETNAMDSETSVVGLGTPKLILTN